VSRDSTVKRKALPPGARRTLRKSKASPPRPQRTQRNIYQC